MPSGQGTSMRQGAGWRSTWWTSVAATNSRALICPSQSGTGTRAKGHRDRRVLVRAAFFALAERPFAPLVRGALRAAADREAALRRPAALFACFDSAPRG